MQSAENGDKPIHVVMTTFKADPTKDQSDRMQIERNTAHTWSHLHPRVKLIMMCYKGEKKEEEQANGEECERDAEGTPLLRTFYHRAFNQYPDAKTYTFINGDIISDRSFLATADAVAMAAQKGHLKKRFLVVGKRTNVEWKKQRVKDVKDSAFNFLNALNAGKKFISIAEDYFMISKDTFRFNDEIPPFVIGRPAYDNWLVHYANLHYYIDSVDATKTVPAIHMTDSEGIV